MLGRGGRASGSFRVPGDFDVLQPVLVRLDDDIGGDGVAGLQLIQHGRRLDGVGHDHRVHEAGDGFVIDVGCASVLVHGDDSALEGIALGSGLAGGGAGLRWSSVAGDRESEQGAQADQGKTWQRQIEWAVHVRSSLSPTIVSDFSGGIQSVSEPRLNPDEIIGLSYGKKDCVAGQ